MLIDTHAHLNFQDYTDIEDVVERALKNKVEKMICVSSNIADSIASIEIARRYEGVVYAAVGIHPQCTDPENKDDIDAQLIKLEALILDNKGIVVGIGECGLDFTDVIEGERRRDVDEQDKLLRGQIGLAKKYDLPILFHFNKSHDFFLNNYRDVQDIKGIFHCYVGGKKRLKRFLEFEKFMFGITGLVTYDEGIGQVVKEIPIDRIVLETDCPFLAPFPHRGERNEPAYISLIAQKVAALKKVSLDLISGQTDVNVREIFNI